MQCCGPVRVKGLRPDNRHDERTALEPKKGYPGDSAWVRDLLEAQRRLGSLLAESSETPSEVLTERNECLTSGQTQLLGIGERTAALRIGWLVRQLPFLVRGPKRGAGVLYPWMRKRPKWRCTCANE